MSILGQWKKIKINYFSVERGCSPVSVVVKEKNERDLCNQTGQKLGQARHQVQHKDSSLEIPGFFSRNTIDGLKGKKAVLRIRDVYPGSDFFPSRIPDPNCFHPGSWICIKEFKYYNPKKWFLSSRKYDPGC